MSAAQDADTLNGTAAFAAGGTGVEAASFTAVEADDDTPPAAACSVAYHVDSAWAGGFTATVTLKNTGPATITGWTLGWTFPGSQRITNGWNATVVQSGAAVTARDSGWNGTLAPGATASFGFQAGYSGSNDAPSGFTLGGAACG